MTIENQPNTIEIYVNVIDDYSATPTQAIILANGLFKILPTPAYDPEDETWQFLPGAIVRCEENEYNGKKYLLAVELVE
jgi:hypothetical protein